MARTTEDGGAPRAWSHLHLWEIAALRDLALVAVFVAALWLLYVLRAVAVPVLVALMLATLMRPLVRGARRRLGVPELVTALLVVAALTVGVLVGARLGLPRVVAAVQGFVSDLPGYVEVVLRDLGITADEVVGELRDRASFGGVQQVLDSTVGILGTFATLLGTLTYLLFAGAFTLALFVWMSVRYQDLPSLRRFLPRTRRRFLESVLQRFEEVFVGFVRGQLLVAMFTTTGFAVGFTLIGVPHAIVVALVGGALSIIPNGQISGWLLAMLLIALDTPAGRAVPWLDVVLGPSVVYAVTQSAETFVITPLVQGSTTRLHPLAVLAAVIGGASVGGIWGILLAIPVTACAWIVLQEIVAPVTRQLADER